MNLVIITTRQELYHRYLCAELAKRHNVVAVLHPVSDASQTRLPRLGPQREQIKNFGLIYYLLRKLAANRLKSFGWDLDRDVCDAERRFFPDAASDYESIVSPKAHEVADINGEEGVSLLTSLEPDVVVCSGGPIYREPLIDAAKLMLNFHTGISPIYNGAWTVFWTYANRQPHLTGGTLMKMSSAVDGGDMLAHYLPAVEADDTPGSLFMKSIAGGVSMYNRVLDHMESGGRITSVPQGRPFLYYHSYQWTVQQTLLIERFVKKRICEKLVRPEIVAEYWNLEDDDAARAAVVETLSGLVFGG